MKTRRLSESQEDLGLAMIILKSDNLEIQPSKPVKRTLIDQSKGEAKEEVHSIFIPFLS